MSDRLELKKDREAFERVIAHLEREFILTECANDHPVLGCASCEAIALRLKLLAFLDEIDA